MAIILFCRNGHDLSTRDGTIYLRRLTPHELAAKAQRLRWESQQPRAPFCLKCGAATLDSCEHCKAAIPENKRPAFCGQCGKPFPWTEISLKSVGEYTDELEDLSTEDKLTLKETFADLTVESPKTELAANRFNRILRKLAPDVADGIKKVIVEIASETAVKLLKR